VDENWLPSFPFALPVAISCNVNAQTAERLLSQNLDSAQIAARPQFHNSDPRNILVAVISLQLLAHN